MAIYCGRLGTEETRRSEVARGRLAGSHEPVSSTRLKVSLPMTTRLSRIIRNNRTVYFVMQYFVLAGTDRWRHYAKFNGKKNFLSNFICQFNLRILTHQLQSYSWRNRDRFGVEILMIYSLFTMDIIQICERDKNKGSL